MNTYSTLKVSIASWLAQSNISSGDTVVDDFLDMAEAEVNRRLRVRFMESATSLTASSITVALPADYMGLRGVYLDGSPQRSMEYHTPEQLNSIANTAGQPYAFTIRGENMVLQAEPDSTYTIQVHYYAKPTALSVSNETNWITNNYPQTYLHGALKYAAQYVSDDAALAKWSAMFDKDLADIEATDDFEKYGPAPRMKSETCKW